MMIELRASQMPMVMVCPYSGTNPDRLNSIERYSESAGFGTLVHSLIEKAIETGETPFDDTAGVPECLDLFCDYWSLLGEIFDKPVLEKYFETKLMSDIKLTGHIDVHQIKDNEIYGIDWKTGYGDHNYYHQIASYCYLLWSSVGFRDDAVIRFSILNVRNSSLNSAFKFGADDLKYWKETAVSTLRLGGYVINDKCTYCRYGNSCPALDSWASRAASYLNINANTLREATPTERRLAFRNLHTLEAGVKDIKKAIKTEVKVNGDLDIGDGRKYTIDSAGKLVKRLKKNESN